MKKISVFIIAATILVTGCGKSANNQEKTNTNRETKIIENKTKEVETKNKKTVPKISDKLIAEVLENKTTFFDIESGEKMYLKNYSSDNYMSPDDTGKYIYDDNDDYDEERPEIKINRWCEVDLDSDGKKETLLELSTTNILVLRNEEGVVYGYSFAFRGMKRVKKDGAFESSSSAADTYVLKL